MSAPFDGSVDTSSGIDSGDTSSSPVSTPSDGGGSTDTGLNPAWNPLMSELPEYFHDKAKGHLKTWDDNYRKLETEYNATKEKYAPYEPYIGTDPETLQYATQVWDAINTEPLKVYNMLVEHLKATGQMPGQPPEQQQPDNDGQPLDPQTQQYRDLERRQAELDQRQQQVDNYIKQQDYNRQVESHSQTIDTQVRGLVEKYGNAVDVEDLLQRMYVQTTNGKPFNAEAAFNDQRATFQRLYQRQAGGKPAPQIIPTTGTPAPSGEIKPEDMNEEQRKNYFKYLLDIRNSGG